MGCSFPIYCIFQDFKYIEAYKVLILWNDVINSCTLSLTISFIHSIWSSGSCFFVLRTIPLPYCALSLPSFLVLVSLQLNKLNIELDNVLTNFFCLISPIFAIFHTFSPVRRLHLNFETKQLIQVTSKSTFRTSFIYS